MKILVLGGGGREHALAWKLHKDDPQAEIIAVPGNAGMAALAHCVPIRADDVDGILSLARGEQPDITIVGPEGPLAAGIVDHFQSNGFPIFGPTRAAAQIETSKRFAKDLMLRAGVPTARATHHTTISSAKRAAMEMGAPSVIKASGLAAGKGVVVAETLAQAERAIDTMLRDGAFGTAGSEILVEEFMDGEELSVFAVCDGERAIMMRGVQDHKRLEDGDRGPNTGGMGAYLPVSLDTPETRSKIQNRIFEPVLAALRDMGMPFTGLLYAGLMLTKEGPKVVEFNCRFGDPETQALLPLMEGPLLDVISTVARGESLVNFPQFTWRLGASVTTVIAAAGYPSHPRLGEPIVFPRPVHDIYVFHSGTRETEDGGIVTAGGRVLSITAVSGTLNEAAIASRAYAERIQFLGKQMRHDIGWRELQREVLAGA
jgi:phosphoribosylamine--glycine ligase